MRPPSILFIDDNPSLVAAYQLSLSELGFRVVAASNGNQALDLCAREAGACLAIVDLKMPDMDGPEVIAALREQQPDLQVIVVSGQSLQPYFTRLSELGVRVFLQKPFSIEALVGSIRELQAA